MSEGDTWADIGAALPLASASSIQASRAALQRADQGDDRRGTGAVLLKFITSREHAYSRLSE